MPKEDGPQFEDDRTPARSDDLPADVGELVRRVEEATVAYAAGDMRRYLTLIDHADGYTLADPLGGPAGRHPHRARDLDGAASAFASGTGSLDVLHVHAWDDTAVLVAVERQHGRVGSLPVQDWSLRITLAFRRREGGWELVHRHADPLVHRFGLDQVAALARGEAPESGRA